MNKNKALLIIIIIVSIMLVIVGFILKETSIKTNKTTAPKYINEIDGVRYNTSEKFTSTHKNEVLELKDIEFSNIDKNYILKMKICNISNQTIDDEVKIIFLSEDNEEIDYMYESLPLLEPKTCMISEMYSIKPKIFEAIDFKIELRNNKMKS